MRLDSLTTAKAALAEDTPGQRSDNKRANPTAEDQMTKISQVEARQLLKRVRELESMERNRRMRYARDYPGGVHIASTTYSNALEFLPAVVDNGAALYHAVNKVLAVIGSAGEIDSRHPATIDLIGVLHDIDGGRYNETLSTLTAQGGDAVAPWPDFAGNQIRDKDRIRHPDGTAGTVLHLPKLGEGGEAWRVVYEHGDISRLSLQIGDKGQAVVVTTPPAPSSSAVEGLVARLQKTVSDLGEHRQTHVVWRDWLQKSPDNEKVNPHAGSAEFHAGVILDYDRHLANINDAIQALASTAASGGDELPDVACADGTLVPGWIAANIARISAWFRENGSENWHVCGIGPIAEPPGGYMLVRKAVVNFLDGSGPLNGYWFDQTVPGKPYWWRKYLHEQPLAASAQGDGDGN